MKTTVTCDVFVAVIAVCCAAFACSTNEPERARLGAHPFSERVEVAGKACSVVERMAHYGVKGLSIAIEHDGDVVWAKGYGWADEHGRRAVTTDTLFKPGSISKSLNAVGVLKLVQDGRLDLDVDVNTQLKSWQFPYEAAANGKKITLANLLSHTAGLSVYGGFPGYERNAKIPSLPEILDGKEPANTPPVRSLFEPGLRFEYSGGGTLISQLVLTDTTGRDYESCMRSTVLEPLGMTHSFYSTWPPEPSRVRDLAVGYNAEGAQVASTKHVYPEQAAMGLWTTPTELCRYVIEMQHAYAARSSRVLNQAYARLHMTPFLDANAALGTFVQEREGEKYFFHDAGNEGFRGLYFASIDHEYGVVVFVNSDDGRIILELLNAVGAEYGWIGFHDAPRNP